MSKQLNGEILLANPQLKSSVNLICFSSMECLDVIVVPIESLCTLLLY